MGIHPAFIQLLTVCVFIAATELIAEGDGHGFRAVCGLAVALSAVRVILGILQQERF